MPFGTHFLNVSIFPHAYSRVARDTMLRHKGFYKTFKKSVIAGSVIAIDCTEGTQLVKDIISTQLKAFGYKSLFTISLGPIISTI